MVLWGRFLLFLFFSIPASRIFFYGACTKKYGAGTKKYGGPTLDSFIFHLKERLFNLSIKVATKIGAIFKYFFMKFVELASKLL